MADQQSTLSVFTLPAGTVCHRNGVLFTLLHATQIECHPDNWRLIREQQARRKDVTDARLEAAKQGLRNSADRLSAAWTEVLQKTPESPRLERSVPTTLPSPVRQGFANWLRKMAAALEAWRS